MTSFLKEGGNLYGTEIHKIIKAVLLDMFQTKVSDDQATDISKQMTISDVLALDAAIESGDEETIASVLKVGELTEYIYPGRGGLKSVASQRPTTTKNAPASTTASGAKPVAGGNVVATGRPEPKEPEDAEDEEVSEDFQKELELLKRRIQ